MKLKDFFKKKNKIETDSVSETNIENNNIKSKKKFKKRYIPLIILIVLIFAVIGARIYFNNERVKNLIENIVYSSTNRKLEIGDFKYSLLFPNIQINDAILYNSTNFNEAKNISIDNVRLRFSLFSLFLLKLNIKEFSIDNLYINMFTDESGNLNLPDLPPSEPKIKDTNKAPFDFHKLDFLKFKANIENIRINN
ncbi:AsmA family protein, partial [Brachyspira catarrhinii]